MAQIMEPEISQTGASDSSLPGRPESVPLLAAKDVSGRALGPAARQHGVSAGIEGYRPALPVLGLFQPQDTLSAIYPIPRQAERLTLPQSRKQGQLHNVSKVRVL